MIDYPHNPCRHVNLLARSQSSTFEVIVDTRLSIFFSAISSSMSQECQSSHFTRYVCVLHLSSPHIRNIHSSLRDLFGSLRHSRYPSDVLVPDLVIALLFRISSSRSPRSVCSCLLVVVRVPVPYSIAKITQLVPKLNYVFRPMSSSRDVSFSKYSVFSKVLIFLSRR